MILDNKQITKFLDSIDIDEVLSKIFSTETTENKDVDSLYYENLNVAKSIREMGIFLYKNNIKYEFIDLLEHYMNLEILSFLMTALLLQESDSSLEYKEKTKIILFKILEMKIATMLYAELKFILDRNENELDKIINSYNNFIEVMHSKYLYDITKEPLFPNYNLLLIKNPFDRFTDNKIIREDFLKTIISSYFDNKNLKYEKEYKLKYGRVDFLVDDNYAIEVKNDSLLMNDIFQCEKYKIGNNYKFVLIGYPIGKKMFENAKDFDISIYTYKVINKYPVINIEIKHESGEDVGLFDEIIEYVDF